MTNKKLKTPRNILHVESSDVFLEKPKHMFDASKKLFMCVAINLEKILTIKVFHFRNFISLSFSLFAVFFILDRKEKLAIFYG